MSVKQHLPDAETLSRRSMSIQVVLRADKTRICVMLFRLHIVYMTSLRMLLAHSTMLPHSLEAAESGCSIPNTNLASGDAA